MSQLVTGHSWLPRTSCAGTCLTAGLGSPESATLGVLRSVWRLTLALTLLPALPLLAVPLPGRLHVQRLYCRLMLACLGIRITLSGGPIRNLRGVLVVSNHVSWADVFAIGAVLPGSFVARADLVDWPAFGAAARLMNVIPIERASLRGLPGVVGAVTARLRDGRTVVAFPEGTTWCGAGQEHLQRAHHGHVHHGPFHPAMFQAAIDSGRPVQPLRLSYHHRDGGPSTVTAFFGEDSLGASLLRTVRARRTVVHVAVRPLELPAASRRELAARCARAVRAC